MIRPLRLVLALSLALGFSASASALSFKPSIPFLAKRAPAQLDRVWAQDGSDLKPDEQVRFGTLPNGMRYAVMRNATPKGQASFRLRVGTGSLEENDNQQGLAHFLEHMAFNGSTNVPPGEMVKILERHGLAFGADTNASTGWTQTVYQLDLPETDEDTVDTSMMLLREQAGELLIGAEAMKTERGVVLSEERARDNPSYRVFKAQLEFLLKGQLAARRMPIGTIEVLQKADRDLLNDYYRKYYRPERTTFVAVGDFDPAAMEAKIRARFGDWKGVGKAGPDPRLGTVAPRKTEARVVVEPGGGAQIQVGWIKPFDASIDTAAKRSRDMVESIGFAVVDRRMERLARSENPPFISAGVGREDYFRSARIATLSVSADPARWREALNAAEQAQRRAVEYGVSQAEVDREISEIRASLQAQTQSAPTRRTPRLADALVDSVDGDSVFTAPDDDLALFEQSVKGLTAEKVGAALKAAFSGEGPLLFMSTPAAIPGGETTLATAYAQSRAAPVEALATAAGKSWPYTGFGAPGTVAEQTQVLDMDATFVRFANGVRLTVKPTKFRRNQILVSMRIGAGDLELPKDKVTPEWAAGFGYVQGGLKQITYEDMEEALASKIANVSFGIGEDAFSLSGSTQPEDLDTQMQVLAAYLSEPGWRPEGFRRMQTFGETMHRQMAATPGGVMQRDLGSLMHSGDKRWGIPSLAEMQAQKPEDLRALLEGPLSKGAVEVTMVGDVSVEKAIEAVAKTLGALPARPAPTPPPASGREVRFPSPTAQPVVLTHGGRPDQARAYVAWQTRDFFADPQEQRNLRMAERVLDLRLIDEVRVKQGATYSPGTDWDSSLIFPGYGYVAATVEIPPEKVAGFFADVSKIVGDLRTKPITADELERARKPRIEAIQKAQQTNEYWLGQLSGAQTDPRRLDIVRQSISGLERVTAADVQKSAAAYLTDERAWKLTIVPEAK